MGHDHHHHSSDAATPVLGIALALTLGFMVVEAAVGWLSGSLALVADAGHMLADAGALALALVAAKVAKRPRSASKTYGYRRAEVIAAFVNGIALVVIALLISVEAVKRWLAPVPIAGGLMLLASVVGLLVNVLVAGLLWRSQHASINIRAALVHVLGDALGSVGAIVAAIGVIGWKLYRVDPILSVLIAMMVALGAWRVLKESLRVLLEGVPPQIDLQAIERTIGESPGVDSFHDLHVWRLSDGFDALTVHVVVSRGRHGVAVCRELAVRIREDHGLEHVTIQPEAPAPDDLVRLRVEKSTAEAR